MNRPDSLDVTVLAQTGSPILADGTPSVNRLGVPTIVLFGPTDPRVWAPPFPEVVVLRSSTGAMAAIASDDVVRALDRSF